jgi:hypothetical protein
MAMNYEQFKEVRDALIVTNTREEQLVKYY